MKVGAEFWATRVEAAKLETISANEYVRRHGLSVAALYYWQRKLKPNAGAGEARWESKFIALCVAALYPYSYTLVTPPSACIWKCRRSPPRSGWQRLIVFCRTCADVPRLSYRTNLSVPRADRLQDNGLSVMVEQELGLNPFGSALYVFVNR
mgnify:CR=1 FL=1